MPRNTPRAVTRRGRPYGRPISWIFVIAVVVVFTTGGIALIITNWALFWTCFGLLILAAPIGRAIHITDDRMTWANPFPGEDDKRR